jgi:predicted TIM-barrel fold metal-dependent hydrolase
MAIVDFHLHFFSRPFFDTLAEQSPLAGTAAEKLAQAAETAGFELPDEDLDRHLARWIADLDRHGVEHAACFASVPEEIPAVAQAAARAEGRLSPFALVNPKVEGAHQRVRGLIEDKGFKGVVLFPAMHHYHLGGPQAAELLAVLEEYGAIAYVHCGLLVVKLRDLLGLPRPQDLAFASPLGLIPAANAHLNVKFVVPHFGAGFLRELMMAGAMCSNVYTDTSSSNSWIQTQVPQLGLRDVLREALDNLGPERILFGTDSNVFPAGWREDRYAAQREALELLGTPRAHQELIFGGNARRLLGLDQA